MHPLTDLSGLSIEQLELRISDLTKKYFSTQNHQIHSQITLLIEESREEIKLRNARTKLEQENNPQEPDSGLDNLIKVR
jgi:hypothetical protein